MSLKFRITRTSPYFVIRLTDYPIFLKNCQIPTVPARRPAPPVPQVQPAFSYQPSSATRSSIPTASVNTASGSSSYGQAQPSLPPLVYPGTGSGSSSTSLHRTSSSDIQYPHPVSPSSLNASFESISPSKILGTSKEKNKDSCSIQ